MKNVKELLEPNEKLGFHRRLSGMHYEFGSLSERVGPNIAQWIAESGVYPTLQKVNGYISKQKNHAEHSSKTIIISNKILFVHIPKAAGTSISTAVYGGKAGDHRSALDYALIFTKQQQNSLLKFSITRDPTARFISAFNYLKAGGRNIHDEFTRDEYLFDTNTAYDFAIKLKDNPDLKDLLHFRDQISFLKFPRSKQFFVDFLWKIEDLSHAETEISKMTGRKIVFQRANSSKVAVSTSSKRFRSLQTIIEETYASDFDQLDY